MKTPTLTTVITSYISISILSQLSAAHSQYSVTVEIVVKMTELENVLTRISSELDDCVAFWTKYSHDETEG